MKLIYVAHPYGGKWHNKRKVERIIRELVKQYPNYTFYSPIHALGFMYRNIDYDKGMQHCLEILKRCDELWLCEGWQDSRGCRTEYEEAMYMGMPKREIVGDEVRILRGKAAREAIESEVEQNGDN